MKSLNSDGASYIVTDFYPDSETVFTFKFNDTAWDVSYEAYYGTAEYRFRLQRNGSNSNALCVDLYGLTIASVEWIPTGDHVFVSDCPNATFTIDDGVYKKTGKPLTEYVQNAYPLLIFAHGRNSSNPTLPDAPAKLELYEASVMQNGALTHKWRPAIDADGIPCLYDTVVKKCLYNAGTGTFTFDE